MFERCVPGGNDTIDGGDGDDQIRAGMGDDIATGGNGNDLIVGDLAFVTFPVFGDFEEEDIEDLDDFIDFLLGLSDEDLTFFLFEGLYIYDAAAGGGNDDITGGAGVDVLIGAGGHDIVAPTPTTPWCPVVPGPTSVPQEGRHLRCVAGPGDARPQRGHPRARRRVHGGRRERRRQSVGARHRRRADQGHADDRRHGGHVQPTPAQRAATSTSMRSGARSSSAPVTSPSPSSRARTLEEVFDLCLDGTEDPEVAAAFARAIVVVGEDSYIQSGSKRITLTLAVPVVPPVVPPAVQAQTATQALPVTGGDLGLALAGLGLVALGAAVTAELKRRGTCSRSTPSPTKTRTPSVSVSNSRDADTREPGGTVQRRGAARRSR